MVHLKDFSLLSPTIQSSDVFKAIEAAIPPIAIEQASAKTKACEQRRRSLPAQLVVCARNCDESVALRFHDRCAEKLN